MIGQTVIPVNAENELTLENFITGKNAALLQQLKALVNGISGSQSGASALPRLTYLWAESGAGKTHLIHGLCDQSRKTQVSCQFLSMSEAGIGHRLDEFKPSTDLVCVDNLQVICGDRELEIAFLSFYERLRASESCLVVSARKPPKEAGFVLPDLVSRLGAGVIWRVLPMSDDEKRAALQQRAEARGFDLNAQVLDFVMRHFDRDTVSLFALLDRLDRASLAHQRKVTVPFIKEVIG